MRIKPLFPWWFFPATFILATSILISSFYFYQYCDRQFSRIELTFIPPPKEVNGWQKRTGYLKKDRIYLLDDEGKWREYRMRKIISKKKTVIFGSKEWNEIKDREIDRGITICFPVGKSSVGST